MPTYYDEKTKTYYVSFYYKDFSGNTHRKLKRGFKLSREAKEYERNYIAKMQGSTSMIFSDLAKYYIQDLKTRAKPSTVLSRQHAIDKYFAPTFAKHQIENITAGHIRKWQIQMGETGLKSTSVGTLHRYLTSVFKHAMKYYGLKDNPCTLAGNVPKSKGHVVNYWTLEEYNKFIQAITPEQVKLKRHPAPFMITVYDTLFYTGIREGELLALTIEDYNPTEKTLTINKTFNRLQRKDYITAPKTHKSNRTISLPDMLCLELDQHIQGLPDTSTTAPLFPKLSRIMIGDGITKFSKLAGIKKIRIHDLRHSHASLLINLGVQPLAISERLGHETIQTTLNIYAHLYPKTASQIAQLLNESMTNSIKTVSVDTKNSDS